jgi:hypothetical protein
MSDGKRRKFWGRREGHKANKAVQEKPTSSGFAFVRFVAFCKWLSL